MQVSLKVLSIFLVFGVLSCNLGGSNSTGQGGGDEKEKKFENFAKQLEKSILEGNYKFLNTSWDIELFKQKVMSVRKITSNVLESGEKYYRKVIYKSNNDMVDEVKRYGKLHLSRFHIENNTPKAFYTYETDLGINFIEFVFSMKGDEIKIVDYYNFQMGEYYSQSVNKLIFNVNKYGTSRGAYVDAMQLISTAIAQVKDERESTAWKTINGINEELLKDNYFQTKRIMIAARVSKKAYYQAVEDFLSYYPQNDKLQLYYKVNLYYMKKDRKNLGESVAKMEEIVGESDLFTKWSKSL